MTLRTEFALSSHRMVKSCLIYVKKGMSIQQGFVSKEEISEKWDTLPKTHIYPEIRPHQ